MISKIIQLHDMVKIRFGVTIVGPTGGGKSVACKCSKNDCFRLYHEIYFYSSLLLHIFTCFIGLLCLFYLFLETQMK